MLFKCIIPCTAYTMFSCCLNLLIHAFFFFLFVFLSEMICLSSFCKGECVFMGLNLFTLVKVHVNLRTQKGKPDFF